MHPINVLIKNVCMIKELLVDNAWRSELGTHAARQNAANWDVESLLPRAFLAQAGMIVFELVDILLILEWARSGTLWKVSYSQITIELGYNECGLCDSSAIALHILWYQVTLYKAFFFLLLVRHRARTVNITTLPIIRSNILFQDVGYFENSTTCSSLRKQTF
jgi:hypothetical protein